MSVKPIPGASRKRLFQEQSPEDIIWMWHYKEMKIMESGDSYWPRPWSGVLREKLTVCQLVKNAPLILWNLKVNDSLHKSLPLVAILSQLNPVHIHSSYFLEDLFYQNMAHPQVAGGERPPDVQGTVYWISSWGHLTKGVLAAWSVGECLTTPNYKGLTMLRNG